MDRAPRSGEIIEIRNDRHSKPFYGLYKWSYSKPDPRYPSGDGRMIFTKIPVWLSVDQIGVERVLLDDHQLTWRPYKGSPSAYVDPTGGEQYKARYLDSEAPPKFGTELPKPPSYEDHDRMLRLGWLFYAGFVLIYLALVVVMYASGAFRLSELAGLLFWVGAAVCGMLLIALPIYMVKTRR